MHWEDPRAFTLDMTVFNVLHVVLVGQILVKMFLHDHEAVLYEEEEPIF